MGGTFVQFRDGDLLDAEEDIAGAQIVAEGATSRGILGVGIAAYGAWFNDHLMTLSDQVRALSGVEHCTSVWGRFALSNQAKNHSPKGRACGALNCAK